MRDVLLLSIPHFLRFMEINIKTQAHSRQTSEIVQQTNKRQLPTCLWMQKGVRVCCNECMYGFFVVFFLKVTNAKIVKSSIEEHQHRQTPQLTPSLPQPPFRLFIYYPLN